MGRLIAFRLYRAQIPSETRDRYPFFLLVSYLFLSDLFLFFSLFFFLSIPRQTGFVSRMPPCPAAAQPPLTTFHLLRKREKWATKEDKINQRENKKTKKKVNSQTRKPLPPPSSTRAKVKTRETREPEKRAAHLYTVYIYCIRDDNRQKRSDSFCQKEFLFDSFLIPQDCVLASVAVGPHSLLIFSVFYFLLFFSYTRFFLIT